MTTKMIASKADGIGRMTFNNPEKLNAVSLEMWLAALDMMADFRADPSIRVVVLNGAGPKAFVSGADISKFADERQQADAVQAYQATTERFYTELQAMPMPTIAMIRGYCIGGGTAIAICCDLRIATEGAKFGVPAAKLGLGYGMARAKPLIDLVGPSFAMEMFFTGRQFDAQEARAMGLVNRLVADAELEPTVDALARQIADNAPLTVRAAKMVVRELVKDAGVRNVAACDAAVQACFASADYKEGQAAFLEKRKPKFVGR